MVNPTDEEERFLARKGLRDTSVCECVVERKYEQLKLPTYKNRAGRELFYRLTRNENIIGSYFEKSKALQQWQISFGSRRIRIPKSDNNP
jgi:hypothetical protein